MKKIALSMFLLASILSCKKENKEEIVEQVQPPTVKDHLTATINGAEFSVDDFFTTIVKTPAGDEYIFDAPKTVATGISNIELIGKIKTGTFKIDGTTPAQFEAHYQINNEKYYANKGTMTVAVVDTLKGGLQKYVATFSFDTDTINGVSYQIKNGDVYYIR